VLTQLRVGETAEAELAVQQGAKQTGVLFCEEIEALVPMLVLRLGFCQFVQFCYADVRGGDGRDELEITVIGGGEGFAQRRQRVNGLFHRRPTCRRGTVAVLHLAILLEKRDRVDGGFKAQDETELVVHLDAHRPHLMFDARAEPALVKAIAQLSLVVAIELASEKGGNICGFDRMSKRFQEMRVKGLQRLSLLEDQVGGILGLHDAPVIGEFQVGDDRAILLGQCVQMLVQHFHIERVG